MDIATIVGLVAGFALVVMAILLGGSIGPFIDPPSILIVVAGSFAITTVAFNLGEVIGAQMVMMKTIFGALPDPVEECKKMLEIAQKARANGLLGIQGDVEQIDNEFLKQGLTLAVDGTNPEVIERIMNTDTATQNLSAFIKKLPKLRLLWGLLEP